MRAPYPRTPRPRLMRASLLLASSFVLAAVVPAQKKVDFVKDVAPILVKRCAECHGADDPLIPKEQVEGFQKEMKEAGAELQFEAYPGAKHSFTNPGADGIAKKFGLAALAYDKDADEKSWAAMQALFGSVWAAGK